MVRPPAHTGGVVAIAAALPMEVAGLGKLGRFTKDCIGNIEYMRGDVRGTGAALFVSGMGGGRAFETASAACRELQLRAYVSIGLSGSLSPALRAGHVAVGVKVTDPSGKEYHSDRLLAKIAMEALAGEKGIGFGTLLALDRVIVSAGEKRELARSCNCIAVDMESAGAARAAMEAGVPFIAIRAISDGLDEDLPVDFNRFNADGRMDWPRFLQHVITHPGTIGPLMRLGRNSRTAVTNLTQALEKVLAAMDV